MKNLKVLVFAVVFLGGCFVLANSAEAADRYVDSAAAGGGNGTIETPYNTTAAAISGAVDGDTIFLKGSFNIGIYPAEKSFTWSKWPGEESVTVTSSANGYCFYATGSSSHTFNDITFIANTTLTSAFRITDTASGEYVFNRCTLTAEAMRASAMLFRQNRLSCSGFALNDCVIQLNAGATSITPFLGSASNYDYFTIQRCTISSSTGRSIGATTTDNTTIGILTFEDNIITAPKVGAGFSNLVKYNTVNINRNRITSTGETSGIFVSPTITQSTINIKDNYIDSVGVGRCIQVGKDTSPDGQAWPYLYSVNIERNTCIQSGYYGTANSFHGISVFYPYDTTIQNNYVAGANWN